MVLNRVSILYYHSHIITRASLVAQMVTNLIIMWETWSSPWVGKILWRREWQPTPVFLPGDLHGQRSLEGYNPWGYKELDMTERLSTSMSSRAVLRPLGF